MEGSAASGLVQAAGLSAVWKRILPHSPAERNTFVSRTAHADSAQASLTLVPQRRASALHALAEDVLGTVQAAGILAAPLLPEDRSAPCACPCCSITWCSTQAKDAHVPVLKGACRACAGPGEEPVGSTAAAASVLVEAEGAGRGAAALGLSQPLGQVSPKPQVAADALAALAHFVPRLLRSDLASDRPVFAQSAMVEGRMAVGGRTWPDPLRMVRLHQT